MYGWIFTNCTAEIVGEVLEIERPRTTNKSLWANGINNAVVLRATMMRRSGGYFPLTLDESRVDNNNSQSIDQTAFYSMAD